MDYSNQQDKAIVLKSGKQLRQFYVGQIMYVSTSAYVSSVHLINTHKVESFSVLLKNIEMLLAPYGFIRINRNELINMKYFKELYEKNKHIAVMQNDQEFVVSCRRVAAIRQFLQRNI
ncbi:MAG TPA: hypothetical protein DCS93_06290 [Microscillaceae bacterium]|nr:hypothetical protein [Microscillaceae bacterium]